MLGVADAEAHVVEELAPSRDAVCQPVHLERAHERAYDGGSSRSCAFSRPAAHRRRPKVKNRRVHLARSSRAVAVLVAVVAASGAIIAPPGVGAATTARRRPNVLFVLTDDLDRSELRFMPHTRRLIGDAGATFDNYFVSNSLCCPSRVTTLRGQYAHNTGVWSNSSSNGGFERAFREGIEQDTVATRLSGAGYRTALVGKYLNGYPNGVSPDVPAPGMDHVRQPFVRHPVRGVRLHAQRQRPARVPRPPQPRLRDPRVRAPHRSTSCAPRCTRTCPFFAYLAVYAPHQPATPARRDASALSTRSSAAHGRVQPG